MNGIIEDASRSDLPEILRVQKAAFLPIATLLNRATLAPITQTLSEIEAEYDSCFIFKYTLEGRIMGSVRAHLDGDRVCHIRKLVVLPEHQGAGIGKALMHTVHSRFFDCKKFILFTGKDVSHIVDFYLKLGYIEKYIKMIDNTLMVYMERDCI